MHAFEETYARLRRLMLGAAPRMSVTKDTAREVQLHATWSRPAKPGEPMWFGGVRVGKAYVSYYLMPVYTHASLRAEIPSELVKRMQGKACFNFKRPEPALSQQLGRLTRRCARVYHRALALPGTARAVKEARRKSTSAVCLRKGLGAPGSAFPPRVCAGASQTHFQQVLFTGRRYRF